MAHRVTLIPGDGIGPELAEASTRVLDASGVTFEWEVVEAGEAVMAKYGTPLPEHVLESITRNHPLVDGNKRLGWLATVTFCWINGWVVDGPDDEVYDLVVDVATGSMPYAVSARRLAGWLSPRDG